MTFQEVEDLLRSTPTAYGELPPEAKDAIVAEFPPGQFFTDTQRAILKDWWLAVSQVDVDDINAALGPNTQVSALEDAGQLYLSSDLITDSVNPGQTYHAAAAIITAMVLVNIPGGITPPPPPPDPV